MAYRNSTSKWASTEMVIPKPGTSKFRLIVDLRPVNKYSDNYHYHITNIGQDLVKLR